MIHLGKSAKCLRERLGYSQREAGKALGISYPHLNAIENGKASPTAGMIERYYTAWGIDLYMMAMIMFDDGSRLSWLGPQADERLRSDWKVHLDQAVFFKRLKKGESDAE